MNKSIVELAVWEAIIVAVTLLGRWAFSVDTHAQEGGGSTPTVTPTSLLDEEGDDGDEEKRENVLDCSDPGNSGHPQCTNPDPTSTPQPTSTPRPTFTRTPTPIPTPTKTPTPVTGPPIPFIPTEVPCPLVGLAGHAMRQVVRGRRRQSRQRPTRQRTRRHPRQHTPRRRLEPVPSPLSAHAPPSHLRLPRHSRPHPEA